MASGKTKLGVASLAALVAVVAFIIFGPKTESSDHSALAPSELTGKTQLPAAVVPVLNERRAVEVPALNEQGMELVTYLLLDDMKASIRGADTQLTAEDTLRLSGIDLKTTAEQYYADYDANEVAADQKYRGKKILLTGVIESINKDFMGDAYLVLKASNPFLGVHAELNERGMAGASVLAKDTTIYLVCDSGTRIIGSAVARNCQQFSQYLDQIRPSLKLAVEKQLGEQSPTPTRLVQVLRVMYLVGTQLPPDSPCFTRTDDACKASVAAIEEDKAKMQVLAEQFKRTFPAGASSNSVQQANPGSKTYTNSRYGFQVDYPESFVPQQPPENGDGLTFNSQDGKALLVVSGGNNPGFTVEDEFYKAIKNIHGQLGYKEAGRSWFAVSWTDGDNIGYTKEFVGLRSLNTFTITFPVERKAEYNSIVTNIEKAFRPGDLDNSH
jgi:hypothetical protein